MARVVIHFVLLIKFFFIILYLYDATECFFTSYASNLTLFQGHVRDKSGLPRPSKVRTTLSESRSAVLPKNWLWNDINGRNYLTIIKNQHIPQYCGSCWAQAASSSLSDRIKIARHAEWPDVNISPQVLISCGPGDGCHGGDAGQANEWMSKNDISDETCSIYQARGHDNGLQCSSLERCENCVPQKSGIDSCSTPSKYLKYRVDEYADVKGKNVKEQEHNMMAEIYHRGPISCGISATDELVAFNGSGIFQDKKNSTNINHDISVVGFGVDPSTQTNYWLIRNSWGTYWGDKGFFKLIRGVNNLGIESGFCSWATPVISWKNTKLVQPNSSLWSTNFQIFLKNLKLLFKLAKTEIVQPQHETFFNLSHKQCRVSYATYLNGPLILKNQPSDYVLTHNLPPVWDWRNVNGTNYLSWNVNQHIPHYCGSCWAQATLSALADRFIIADNKRFANIAFSPQVVINCRAGGSCHGGNPVAVYEFAAKVGIPELSCMLYDATDHKKVTNCHLPNIDVCRDCTWPPPKLGEKPNCWAKTKFNRFFVSEFGHVVGAKNMMKEIWIRGPISCGIHVSPKFQKYSGGIYSEKFNDGEKIEINHEISIVGWGKDSTNGEKFWIGRNSWGTYWGENGFFRIKMFQDNLLVETHCFWAVPLIDK